MQKELLSAYIDGEQVSNEFTAALCRSTDLQRSWDNFHIIRSVMRKESDVMLDVSFTAKIEMLIASEPEIQISQPTPEETSQSPFIQKLRVWLMPAAQVAVAAGVCLVAVLGVQSFNGNSDAQKDIPVLQTPSFSNGVQAVSYNAPMKDVVTQEQIEQKNKRIGAMLQNYELQRRMYADNAQQSK